MPSVVEPSVKVIVPVAPEGTVAVKITAWPAADGLTEEISMTTGVGFDTVTTVAGEVAAVYVTDSGIDAVIGLETIGSDGTVMVATPPTIGTVPSTVDPFEKVTEPVTPAGTC